MDQKSTSALNNTIMKTKKLLLPFLFSMLLFSVVLISTSVSSTSIETEEESRTSQKARYTFSLQLFQTI